MNDLSYTSGSSAPLTIPFTVAEPVERPQALNAYLTGIIYDSDGDLVRVLADGTQAFDIDNLTGTDSGVVDSVGWDGTDDDNGPVDADTYTLAFRCFGNLFPKRAGVPSSRDIRQVRLT